MRKDIYIFAQNDVRNMSSNVTNRISLILISPYPSLQMKVFWFKAGHMCEIQLFSILQHLSCLVFGSRWQVYSTVNVSHQAFVGFLGLKLVVSVVIINTYLMFDLFSLCRELLRQPFHHGWGEVWLHPSRRLPVWGEHRPELPGDQTCGGRAKASSRVTQIPITMLDPLIALPCLQLNTCCLNDIKEKKHQIPVFLVTRIWDGAAAAPAVVFICFSDWSKLVSVSHPVRSELDWGIITIWLVSHRQIRNAPQIWEGTQTFTINWRLKWREVLNYWLLFESVELIWGESSFCLFVSRLGLKLGAQFFSRLSGSS